MAIQLLVLGHPRHPPPRPTGCHARPPQPHKLYLPEGAPAQQQEMGPCGNCQSPRHSSAMEEELWRVRAASSVSCTRSEGWWVWEQPLTPPTHTTSKPLGHLLLAVSFFLCPCLMSLLRVQASKSGQFNSNPLSSSPS